MKRIIACFAAIAALTLSGCEKGVPEGVSDDNITYSAEKLFDYYFSDDMPWDEPKY